MDKQIMNAWKNCMKCKAEQITKNMKDGCKYLRAQWEDFMSAEDGMGVVEVILIIVVLISLVIIFKKQITDLVKNIMKSIEKDSKSVYGS